MSVNQSLTLEQVGQSIANNTSKVRIKWTSQQTGSSYNNAPGDKAYYYITINGGTETEHTVAFTLPQNTTKTILDTTLTVSHKADGTGSIKVRTWMDTEISAGVITQTKTLTLDTIPRASAVSAPKTGTLGTALKITIDRKSASFTDKLYYKVGSKNAVKITGYDGKTTYNWTPPIDLATNAPNSANLAATIICETYNGTAYVGRSECTVTLAIPSSVVPTLSVSVTDPTGNKSKYTGYFLQLRSKIKVAITGTGAQGSTIKSYSIKVGWSAGSGTLYTASAASGTTGLLPYYGTVYITCAVTDSRGRTATKSLSYTVSKYSVPTISAISATRCTQNGTASRTGEYGKVTFTAAITPLSNKNTAAYKVQYREYGTEAWTSVTPTIPEADKYAPKNITTIFPADTNKRYTVRVVATDAFSTSNSSMRDISASFALFHWAKSMLSVGIGRLCDKSRALQVGLNTYIDGELHTNQHLFMGGNATTDNGSNIHFKTTNVATNVHNVRIYGGVGSSTTALGVYDAKNEKSIANYDDVSGKLTLLGFAPANITIGASGSYLKNFSGTAKHISALGLGILRVYGETNVAMPAGKTYDVASIGDHIPTSTYALSVYSLKNMDVRLSTSGIIQIRPKEDIPAGYGIYIAGIWIAN
nr:MAG TPA: protein of unknown function DUF859 [Caudoviricetes sp.]